MRAQREDDDLMRRRLFADGKMMPHLLATLRAPITAMLSERIAFSQPRTRRAAGRGLIETEPFG
jgi:hypothetical protein